MLNDNYQSFELTNLIAVVLFAIRLPSITRHIRAPSLRLASLAQPNISQGLGRHPEGRLMATENKVCSRGRNNGSFTSKVDSRALTYSPRTTQSVFGYTKRLLANSTTRRLAHIPRACLAFIVRPRGWGWTLFHTREDYKLIVWQTKPEQAEP